RAGFALLTARLLEANRDLHISVGTGAQLLQAFNPEAVPNVDGKRLHRLVPGWTKHSNQVHSGRFGDGIGYLVVTSFLRERADEVRAAVDALRGLVDSKALILDVRLNGGGDERLAQELAGCFLDRPAVYAGHRLRDPSAPGGFSAIQRRTLRPNARGPRFRGKVIVLAGPANMSSAEAFLLMMRAAGAKLVGARSYGASGNPQPHALGNGVVVHLPSWQALLPDGTCFEGRGIAPDVEVPADPAGLAAGRDAVLARALQLLRR
ncbi:MAG: S41 family peptidase, partial [Acidobacteriota bacterium]